MFIDSALVSIVAGKGGNGKVSLRHEKFIEKGGPDGGDGGDGGDVIFRADKNANTLVNFRYKHELKAEDGEVGGKRRMHGRAGKNTVVAVPVGTMVYRDDMLIVDLVEDGQEAVVAKGGRGGFGNAHFKSSTRQTPRVAELGEKGEAFEAKLELKLLADVGLIGFPNAGKSTLLSVVTNARPEIGDYAFTTLTPNLGVADIDDTSLLLADIPGLIEGASEGKGLGDAFLKHVERTAVLLHLIDSYSENVVADYYSIRKELGAYSDELVSRREVIALTKIEGQEPKIIQKKQKALEKETGQQVFVISAAAHLNLQELLRKLASEVAAVRADQAAFEPDEEEGMIPTISLGTRERDSAWHVREEEGRYVVTGEKIERFAARTDFTNVHSKNRMRDIMKKLGITHEIIRAGAKDDDIVVFGEDGEYQMTFAENDSEWFSQKQ
jgi:GTP-binding protein